MHKFEGYFIDAEEYDADELMRTNIIRSGTIQGDDGRRILRMKGADRVGEFELKAHEQEPGVFKGKWNYTDDEEDAAEEVELKLYGEPSGDFTLIGHYRYERTKYLWAMELHPYED